MKRPTFITTQERAFGAPGCRPLALAALVLAVAATPAGSRAQQQPGSPGGAAPAAANLDLTAIGLLPHEKKAAEIPPNERNPFAVIVAKIEETPKEDEDATLQENRIRRFFKDERVSGVVQGSRGYKVLIGGMILEEGSMVPPVVPNQTEQLKVSKITEDKMVITWIDEGQAAARSTQARQLEVALKLRPGVVTHPFGIGAAASGDADVENTFTRTQGDLQDELREALEQARSQSGVEE